MTASDPHFEGAPLPRGRHGLKPEFVRASQRERLVRAMLALVGERGYAATTVPAVVAAARASRNAFYAFFADKQACFLAACEEAAAEVIATMQTFGIESDWVLGLRRGFAVFLHWWQQRPGFSLAFLVELPLVGPAAYEQRAHFYTVVEDLFTRLAARIRREQPALPELPEFVPRMLVVAVVELMAEEVRAGRADRLVELQRPLLFLAIRLLADDRTAYAVLDDPAPSTEILVGQTVTAHS